MAGPESVVSSADMTGADPDVSLEGEAGREDERVVTRPGDELDRGGQPVLGGAARESERGPAERAEGIREAQHALAQGEVADPDRRRNERERRRHEQVQPLHELETALAICLVRGARGLSLLLGDGEAALDLRADILAVEVAVAGEEFAMDLGRLGHEGR